MFVVGLSKLEVLNINCCNCITDDDMEPISGNIVLISTQIYMELSFVHIIKINRSIKLFS